MTPDLPRRAVLRAVWAAPVIAVAVATPLAAASATPTPGVPVACTKVSNTHWNVAYNDGTSKLMHNGDVMSDPTLKALCRKGN